MRYKKYRPTNPLNRGYKEKVIVSDISEYLKITHSIDIIHNQKIEGGSSKRRPDILVKLDTHYIIIEIDERQHQTFNYVNDKEQRLNDIIMDLNNVPLILIRFNPDAYKDHNKINKRSVFTKTKGTRLYKIGCPQQYLNRITLLKSIIDKSIIYIPQNSYTEYKLYFDKFNEHNFTKIEHNYNMYNTST